ncbi:MAG: carboxypeptidase regulatory-like domain-containing protein [Proteobacteria bacterium]|nr:carboxypeptidase regulatory-like domain-containing protein [Pseudomonadota bacterium]
MKNIKRINWLLVAFIIAISATSVSYAQNTASAIRGTVTDSEGNVLSGATVVVKHIPTGATKTLTTNDSGNYQARGLRVGGPYSVSISNEGYNSGKQDDVYITLGSVKDVNVAIAAESFDIEEVVVFGHVGQTIFSADNMGSGTAISQETLENAPTISRDVTDFLRLDSRINLRNRGGFSVSGVNNRSNNFSIDGVGANDPFGLEANGFAGNGQPFNIDTIEQLNVQLSPYDVTLSNFTGANVNAVTKSGTNEFTGSINYQFGNESLSRDLANFENTQLSATIGGPIIKDKLFFFLGYEETSNTVLSPSTSVPDSVVQSVIDAARDTYGLDIGTFNVPALNETKENILLKVDWLINENHRASFKYNTNEDVSPSIRGTFRDARSTSTNWFANLFENDTYALNLYSDWSDNFNTELRVSTSQFNKVPIGVVGDLSNFAFVEIEEVGPGDDTVSFGRDRFRQANLLSTETNNFYLEGNYFVGNHTIKAGIDIQENVINNTFIRDAMGNYRFSNLEDFINGDVNRFRYNIGNDPNDQTPAANWSWKNTCLFIQDNWLVNEKVTIQYCLRYDKPSTNDQPLLNPGFEEVFGYSNQNVIGSGVLQPRFGFNYDMSDELSMQLRGGVGVFSGGSPNVWLSNPFSKPGGNLNSYSISGYDGAYIPDGLSQVEPGGGFSRQDVDVIRPGFKLPTVLKSNIALDAELPWYGLQATFEYEYTKQQNAIFYRNLNLGDPTGTLPDGRLSYYADPLTGPGDRDADVTVNRNFAYGEVIELSNTGRGDTKRATISLQKKTEHFFIKGSYTNTSTNEVTPGTSSQASSNWRNRPSINPNDQESGVSNFEIPNAFTLQASYDNNFFGDTLTTVSLFWSSSDGENYSYTYRNDVNGDGISFNDLFYVPNVGEYVMADPSEASDFEAFLADSGLDQYRGQIAPRNAFKAPRVNLWDIKFKQELPAMGRFRATAFLSIKNLGNLLNSDWGQVYNSRFSGLGIAELDGFDDQGRQVLDYRARGSTALENLDQRFIEDSRWQAQVGIRIDF